MRHRLRGWVAAAVLLLGSVGLLGPAPRVAAQEVPATSDVEVPTQEIVPRPNSGDEPSEAGDRGGALQLGILALIMVAVAGSVLHLRRQSQRARATTTDPGPPRTRRQPPKVT